MPIYLDSELPHAVVSANSHYYKQPTPISYIDRTLMHHNLIYVINGSWAINENGVNYELKGGDILLLRAGLRHYTSRPCGAGTKTFCVHIDNLDGDNERNQNKIVLPTHIHTKSADIKKLFENITTVFWSTVPYKEKRLNALVDLLICQIAGEVEKASETPPPTRSSLQDDISIVNAATEIITSKPYVRYRADECSKMLLISERKLSDATRSVTGMTFSAYEQNLKLEMIALMLTTEPDRSIQELAESYAFYDQFHLSKAFKKKYGCPPTQYRKKFAGGTENEDTKDAEKADGPKVSD